MLLNPLPIPRETKQIKNKHPSTNGTFQTTPQKTNFLQEGEIN